MTQFKRGQQVRFILPQTKRRQWKARIIHVMQWGKVRVLVLSPDWIDDDRTIEIDEAYIIR